MINILYNIGLIIVMVTLAAVIYLLLIATTLASAAGGLSSGLFIPIAAIGSMIYCFGIVGLRLYNGHY